MGFSVWLCVLCLQASLLSHALDCSEGSQGELCAGGQTADRQHDDRRQQRGLHLPERLDLFRRKRQLGRRGPTHLSHTSLPGAVSASGLPYILIQADRPRRHLHKKRKLRIGSYSLLSNNKTANPLQVQDWEKVTRVTRVRRQVKLDPTKRGKSGRSGAFSVLGDPQVDGQNDGPERSM